MFNYPLLLSTPTNYQFFGGERLRTQLGKAVDTSEPLTETWEVSDVAGARGMIQNGPYAGWSLTDLLDLDHRALLGAAWSKPPHFPLLLKFIDGSGMFPVHVHADDEQARAEGVWPHGKTESWHILWAEPGATLRIGVREGLDRQTLYDKLAEQAYDEVMYRYPVRPGDTFYVPAGTLHSFGPGVLLAEIQQTADILSQAMPWDMDSGERRTEAQWQAGIRDTVNQTCREPHSGPQHGLVVESRAELERRLCCAGPYFRARTGVASGRIPPSFRPGLDRCQSPRIHNPAVG